ncbi:MAG: protein kinase [Holophagaceae bacterium]|nr:protein kinase [Holophagaceae bacterium]
MIGQTLSHYRILAKLGEGGMGVVYQAEDLKLGRQVALKLLPAEATANEEARKRFIQEARHASGLDHPNICAIHAIEETPEGGLFIVMALCEGKSLRECLHQGPLPWERAVRIELQILAALGHAHSRGLVHRDMKPANVMVGDGDDIKVVDFGLAKAVGAEGLTRTGIVMGTAQYLSPEQVVGKPVDPRSDLWAAGMVFYQMLTNRPAFTGDGIEATLAAILHAEPDPPSSVVPGLPPSLDTILAKALQKDPQHRYAKAESFRQDLLALESDATATLPASPWRSRDRTASNPRPRVARRWIWGGAAGAATLLLAGAGFQLVQRWRKPVALQENKVAVALFANRTGDPAQDLLGRLAAERISEAIAQTGTAETAPLIASLPQSNPEEPADPRALKALAERTGAGLVVSGAFQANGGELQVQAQLFDAKLMKVVALVKPERGPRSQPDEVFGAVAQRMASGVAGRILDPYLDPERIAIPPKFPAYREWLVGWELYWNSRPGAEERFEKAIQLDPDLMVGRLPIAFIRSEQGDFDGVRAQFALLDQSLGRMGTLDRCMVENVRALMEGHSEAALGPIREASRLAPGSPLVNHQHAYTAFFTNHCTEAVAAATRPIRWEKLVNARVPIGSDMGAILAWAHHLLGQYGQELESSGKYLAVYPENTKLKAHRAWAAAGLGRAGEAEALGRELITLDPESALRVAQDLRIHGHRDASARLAQETLHSIQRKLDAGTDSGTKAEPLHAFRMESLYFADRLPECLAAAQAILRRHPSSLPALGRLGIVQADLGRAAEARGVMAQLARLPRKDQFGLVSLLRARIACRLGEKEQALTLLREATAEGQSLGNVRHLDVAFEGLKGYGPFEEFMRPKE